MSQVKSVYTHENPANTPTNASCMYHAETVPHSSFLRLLPLNHQKPQEKCLSKERTSVLEDVVLLRCCQGCQGPFLEAECRIAAKVSEPFQEGACTRLTIEELRQLRASDNLYITCCNYFGIGFRYLSSDWPGAGNEHNIANHVTQLTAPRCEGSSRALGLKQHRMNRRSLRTRARQVAILQFQPVTVRHDMA